ncbi:MAG: hypothetical protein ACI30Y_02900 [Candidatus Limisoma sp.]|nr:hypothetical protein [Muribaculaceae bacterium]MDD6868420.1 hypothetical protein [bacterium]
MKKIISIISLMAVVLLMACSSENDEKFNKLNDLIKNNKVEELAKSADELYMDKAEYTAKELVQLSVAYKYLAEQEMQGRNDATYLADYISRALDCFNKAKDTDSDAVEEYLKDNDLGDFEKVINGMNDELEKAKEAERALIESINA